VNGGLLHVGRDMAEHVAQLAEAVRGHRMAGNGDAQSRRFVEAFVRPFGIDVAATPRLVDALERLAASPASRPQGDPIWAPLARRRLAPRAAELERVAQAARSASAARQTAKLAREERRKARDVERRAKMAERVSREEQRRAQHAEEEVAGRQQRLESLIVDFARLDDTRRRNFLRGIVERIPADSFIDLHAATPPGKLDYPHADIYLRVATRNETFRLRACGKEPFTVEWIHTHVGAGDVFYDIGANVGVYSLIAAKQPGGPARVFSFEASYASVASLCANVVINGVGDHITPMPVALSDRTGMNVFSLRDLEPGAARHALGAVATEDGPAVYQQPVMTYRLDDLIAAFDLPAPNHIKLDVDGGELEVLEGAAKTLASPTLRSMLVEVSTSLSGAVTEILERHGLRLHSKVAVLNKAGEYAVWYGLFDRQHAGARVGGDDQARPVIEVTR
jgi:FkbM family methyltransferase